MQEVGIYSDFKDHQSTMTALDALREFKNQLEPQ